jgi:hypothetical protein
VKALGFCPKHSTDCSIQAKAKQRQREQGASASSSSQHNANNKRPINVIPANSTSPTDPKPPPKLKPDSRLGKYFDYDLSKMVNSKGGFLVEDGQKIDEDSRMKARERERERAMQNLEPRMSIVSYATVMILTMPKPCSLTLSLTRNAKNVTRWTLTRHTGRCLAASSVINARTNTLRNTVFLRRPNARRYVFTCLNSADN